MIVSRRTLAVPVLAAALVANACGSGDAGTTTGASELAYPLVDTGQTAFYDTEGEIDAPAEGELYYGQDAVYEGNQFSFSDNDDGTVTDNVTGLIWEQDPTDDGTVWEEAVDYCDALELADSDDWRIPSLKELFSISDFGTGWPYIDTDYFSLVEARTEKDQQYWTSNYYEVDTELAAADQAFGVNHSTGHIKAYSDGSSMGAQGATQSQNSGPVSTPDDAEGTRPEGSPPGDASEGGPPAGGDGAGDASPASKYVRCVQGDAYGINEFSDNGDGTITDLATGLMWAQDDSGEGVDWASALALAATANEENHLGYSDWKVPDVKELQSIVDYSGVYPAVASFFNVTDEDSYYWSSTSAYFSPESPGYYYAWYVAAGYAIGADGNDSHGAGAVRFDTKVEGGPAAEEPERIFNYVRLVREA